MLLAERYDYDNILNYTIKEAKRIMEGIVKYNQNRQKEKAYFDYMLANEISIAVGRCFSKDVTMPELEEFYPNIFDAEEVKRRKQRQMQERFMAAAAMLNNSFNEEGDN